MAYNWMAKSHQQLYHELNSGQGPSAGDPLADFFSTAFAGLNDIGTRLNESLDLIHQGWQGTSAMWATAAVRIVRNWNTQTGDAISEGYTCVERQQEALRWAKAAMPKPDPAPVPRHETNPFNPYGVDIDAESRAHAAHEQAAQVMATYESISAANTMAFPRFEPLPPVFLPPPDGPGETAADQSTTASAISPNGNSTAQQPVAAAPPPNNPDSTPPPPAVPIHLEQPRFPGGSPPDGTDISHTAPIQQQPPLSSTVPPGGTAGVEQVRTPSGYGPVGYFQGGNSATGRRPGGGTAWRGSVGAEGFAGRNAGATRGGSTGMAGMPGGGVRKQEDEEHKRKYVVDDDQDFLDDQLLPPPVIGEGLR